MGCLLIMVAVLSVVQSTLAPSSTLVPSYAPSSYSPTTAVPSYAPSPVPSWRPSASPTRPPTQTYTLEARRCYDKVDLREAKTDLYCDGRDPADCRGLDVGDCLAYCADAPVMALASDRHGAVLECSCATARRGSCIRVSGASEPFDVTSLSVVLVEGGRAFEGVCVMAEVDVGVSEVCEIFSHGSDDDEGEDEGEKYPPSYCPTYEPSSAPATNRSAAAAPPPEREVIVRRRSAVGLKVAAAVLVAAVAGLVALLARHYADRRRHRRMATSMDSAAEFAPLGDTRRVELTTAPREFV